MTYIEFVEKWAANIGTPPPKEAIGAWKEFVREATNSAVLEDAILRLAKQYADRKNADGGRAKRPTLFDLKREYYGKIAAEKKQAEASRPLCPFCQSQNRIVYVIDNSYRPGEEYPADPATYTGSRCVSFMPCPECRANEYGAREALRQRVKSYCVREDERDTLYRQQTL